MIKKLHELAANYNFYHVRNNTYTQNDNLPFRISPTPFYLNHEEVLKIEEIGILVSNYFKSCSILYNENSEVRKMLDKGKPEIFLPQKLSPDYALIRPDLIYTNHGFILCEIETSLFGLGLTALLNEAYTNATFKTLAHPRKLQNFFRTFLPRTGEIIYTDKTKAYSEQIAYLADKVFSEGSKHWVAKHINERNINSPIYRAFYLSEYIDDPKVKHLLDFYNNNDKKLKYIVPSLTPQVEEKALLSLIWDKRYIDFFKNSLGPRSLHKLQKLIPPTLILGNEQNFSGSLTFTRLEDLAKLPRSKRKYALKVSGFDPKSSWAEGVVFLHEISGEKVQTLLEKALSDKDHLYILQEFFAPKKVNMQYEDGEQLVKVNVGVRITPYYDANTGELITIKATGCQHTNYIHASTDSINTAVALE